MSHEEHPDEPAQEQTQARAHHAPDPRSATWSAAAAASIVAAELAAARRGNDATSALTAGVAPGLSGAGERWEHLERTGPRERRGVVSSFVVEDCARRLAAWAATLPTPEQRQTALAAADVVRQGR